MSRYIDADKLIKKMERRYEEMRLNYGEYDQYNMGFAEAMVAVDNATTADVVEVVRCRDCRYCEEAHYEEEGEEPYIKLKCKWSNYSHQPNDYCSLGERNENGKS